ncbi:MULTISPECIES: hypothetical protein [Streptomyces]|uniref:hypothetical protein n=1 Tax=Streptomyces TaxID=1883 RepID=UPI00163BBA54|nr:MULTISPECIES: hypothetical protein [Streptomyces]MBC2877438.1 hypothetical protein [Streptomyces sp. TYQ1024]UBI38236.1 hypothetical protein K7I03_18440 [Streptomyces mobaraensis]UKW30822.1 hypothetical protein MCU78_18400 [Streptomyces sp. TYQ1024]
MENRYPVPSPLDPVEDAFRRDIEGMKRAIQDLARGKYLDAVASKLNHPESGINASSQKVYWSTQALKGDFSFGTASFDAIKLSESGASALGVQIWTPKWQSAMEERLHKITGGRLGTEAKASAATVEKHGIVLAKHQEAISHLLTARHRDLSRRLEKADQPRRIRMPGRKGQAGTEELRADTAEVRKLKDEVAALKKELA